MAEYVWAVSEILDEGDELLAVCRSEEGCQAVADKSARAELQYYLEAKREGSEQAVVTKYVKRQGEANCYQMDIGCRSDRNPDHWAHVCSYKIQQYEVLP